MKLRENETWTYSRWAEPSSDHGTLTHGCVLYAVFGDERGLGWGRRGRWRQREGTRSPPQERSRAASQLPQETCRYPHPSQARRPADVLGGRGRGRLGADVSTLASRPVTRRRRPPRPSSSLRAGLGSVGLSSPGIPRAAPW